MSMHNVWSKPKALKRRLERLNNDEFKCIGQKMDKAKSELLAVQQQPRTQWSDSLQTQEKIIM